MSLRRIASTAAVTAAIVGTVAMTAPAAQASQFKLVYTHYYTQPNALAQCNADGSAGVTSGQWDYYRCVNLGVNYAELLAYLNIS